jgi:hypothetical protein
MALLVCGDFIFVILLKRGVKFLKLNVVLLKYGASSQLRGE